MSIHRLLASGAINRVLQFNLIDQIWLVVGTAIVGAQGSNQIAQRDTVNQKTPASVAATYLSQVEDADMQFFAGANRAVKFGGTI